MLRRLEEAELSGGRALVRVDFNVPMAEGLVADDSRLRAAAPTVQWLRERGMAVVLCAHFGRPKGEPQTGMSLKPVAFAFGELIEAPVAFCEEPVGAAAEAAAAALKPGEILMVENTRFHPGEEANDPEFAAALARLGDIYVNDAFSAAHRAHASTEGVARLLPSYAGFALEREIDHLTAALEQPNRPVLAVVGGAKVSTKLEILGNLVKKVDRLFIGGAMANTFLLARGHEVGASLVERDLAPQARDILEAAAASGCEILLPVDAVIARELKPHADHEVVDVDSVPADAMILDVGPATVDRLADALAAARTLVWNGPLGAFETPPFDTSTIEAAQYAARRAREQHLVAVAGGGDTVAALNHARAAEDFSFVSTAGGAFLEWLEGRTLPGVAALRAEPA